MTTILIVDDDYQIGELVQIILKPFVYQISQVFDGNGILKVLEQVKPDLILMDLFLPGGLDGLATTQIIRKNEHFQNVPVLAFTAAGSHFNEVTAIQAGFNGLIRKPFSRGDFLDSIAKFLDAPV
jgi:two-component system response regulator MtrA